METGKLENTGNTRSAGRTAVLSGAVGADGGNGSRRAGKKDGRTRARMVLAAITVLAAVGFAIVFFGKRIRDSFNVMVGPGAEKPCRETGPGAEEPQNWMFRHDEVGPGGVDNRFIGKGIRE